MTFWQILDESREGVQEQCPDGNRIWTECKSKKRHVAVTFRNISGESREGGGECPVGTDMKSNTKHRKDGPQHENK